MATSGTYAFSPTLAGLFDEAFERCEIAPSTITGAHIASALRSLNFMLTAWANEQVHLWKVVEETFTPVQAASSRTLTTAGAIDVLEAVVIDTDGNEIPIQPIGRQEWRELVDKTIQGMPDRYWVEKLVGSTVVHFWPARDAIAYQLTFNVLRRLQDAGTMASTLDMPPEWMEAAASDLAARMAQKYASDKFSELTVLAAMAFRSARTANRERASTTFTHDYWTL